MLAPLRLCSMAVLGCGPEPDDEVEIEIRFFANRGRGW